MSDTPDRMMVAAQMAPAAFRAHLDTMFSVGGDGEQVALRLTEVIDGRSDGRIERFSLLFHGPPDRLLPQGMYSFHHDAFAEMVLFIVPILTSNDKRIVYEACFSRILDAAGEP